MDIIVGRSYRDWRDECGTDQVEGFYVLVATDERDPSVEFVHFREFSGSELSIAEALRSKVASAGLTRKHFETSPHWEESMRDVHEAGSYLQQQEIEAW
jgi:hypothetical protein